MKTRARRTGGRCPGCEQSTRGGRIVTGGAAGIPVKEWMRDAWHAYHVPLTSDAEWLKAHAFKVTAAGKLDGRQRSALPASSDRLDKRDIATQAEARDFAIEWQQWQSEQSLSYGELAEWAAYFAELAERFPELADEFRENGII